MSEGNKNYTETEIMLGALDQVIREEMKKRPSKRDNKLIDECIVEMAKLKNVRTGYTEEEIDAIVKQIEAKAAKKTRLPSTACLLPSALFPKPKRSQTYCR